MQSKLRAVVGIAFFMIYTATNAQESWDWNRCLEHALSNNIQLKLNEINLSLAELQVKQQKLAFTPSVNANGGFNINFGRTIDPTTYSFVTRPVQTANMQVNLNQPLFEGLKNIHNNKKAGLDLEAARLDQQALKEDIQLQVMNAYLNVLNAYEQVAQAKDQFNRTQEQYAINKNLVAAGAMAERMLVDIEAQLATEEYNIAFAEQQKELALLAIKTVLQLSPDKEIVLVAPPIESFQGIATLNTPGNIYQTALGIRPEIKSSQVKISSAERAIKAAKGNYYPNISLYSAAGSNYSDQFTERTITDSILGPIGIVEGTGQTVLTLFPQQSITNVPFFKQLNTNLTYAAGISLTIPIYNKRSVYFATEQSRLQLAQAKLNSENAAFTLFSNIQQAYAKAIASGENYKAAEKSLTAAKASYDFALERAAAGAISQLEVNLSASNYYIAQSRFIQAKYDYIFNVKVLDYYEGKTINFD